VACSAKKRGFSLYDIEAYLKEAGAERVNEKALISFEKELEETVEGLVNEAAIYANYAGRRSLIKCSDIELVGAKGGRSNGVISLSNNARKPRRRAVNSRRSMLYKQMDKL
jgi:histone H3/H4